MARKKKDLYPIEGEAWSQLSTPWVQQATDISEKTGANFETARDHVILEYLLRSGDVRPLAGLMQSGEAPGPKVLKCLAAMLEHPAPGDERVSLPYILQAKGKGGRKVKSGELPWRDHLLSKTMEQKMAEGVKYALAPDDIAAELDGIIDRETIRDAYDLRHPKTEG